MKKEKKPKHTRGGISVSSFGLSTWLTDEKDRYIFEVVSSDSEGKFVKNDDERNENALRVEALWNSAEGVPTEVIERINLKDLLEACKWADIILDGYEPPIDKVSLRKYRKGLDALRSAVSALK